MRTTLFGKKGIERFCGVVVCGDVAPFNQLVQQTIKCSGNWLVRNRIVNFMG